MKAFLGKLFSQCYSVKRPAFEFLSLLKIAIESPFSFCESNLWKAFSLYWSLVLKISAKVCFSLKIFFCSVKAFLGKHFSQWKFTFDSVTLWKGLFSQSILLLCESPKSTHLTICPRIYWGFASAGCSLVGTWGVWWKTEWFETVVLIFTKRSTENRDIQPPCLKCLQLVFLLVIT